MAGRAVARYRPPRRELVQSLALSFTAMRTGMGFRHWNRVDGSKWEHCLQQCNSALHLGQLPAKLVPSGRAVEQLKHRGAARVAPVAAALGR